MTLAIAKKQAPDSTSKAKRDGARSALTNSPQGRGSFPVPFIQRKPTCVCGGGCPRCKEHTGSTELKIGQPGDRYEQEADRIAKRITQVSDPQRLEEPLILQRGAQHGAEPAMVPPIVQEVLRSPGQPLDPVTRAFMEPRFGRDFSHVRVHTDARASESAREVNALAYTVGRHIIFGEGQSVWHTANGQRSLAHELAHVVQQERGGPSAPTPQRGGMLEQAAEAAASAFVAGRGAIRVGGASAPVLARQPLFAVPGLSAEERAQERVRKRWQLVPDEGLNEKIARTREELMDNPESAAARSLLERLIKERARRNAIAPRTVAEAISMIKEAWREAEEEDPPDLKRSLALVSSVDEWLQRTATNENYYQHFKGLMRDSAMSSVGMTKASVGGIRYKLSKGGTIGGHWKAAVNALESRDVRESLEIMGNEKPLKETSFYASHKGAERRFKYEAAAYAAVVAGPPLIAGAITATPIVATEAGYLATAARLATGRAAAVFGPAATSAYLWSARNPNLATQLVESTVSTAEEISVEGGTSPQQVIFNLLTLGHAHHADVRLRTPWSTTRIDEPQSPPPYLPAPEAPPARTPPARAGAAGGTTGPIGPAPALGTPSAPVANVAQSSRSRGVGPFGKFYLAVRLGTAAAAPSTQSIAAGGTSGAPSALVTRSAPAPVIGDPVTMPAPIRAAPTADAPTAPKIAELPKPAADAPTMPKVSQTPTTTKDPESPTPPGGGMGEEIASTQAAGSLMRTPGDEYADFLHWLRQETGAVELRAAGEPFTMQPHGWARQGRQTVGVSGYSYQSVHGLPQSVGRGMPNYNPRAALTTLEQVGVHTGMDAHWKSEFQAMRRSGRTTATAQEIYDTVAESIQRAPDLPQGYKDALKLRLQDEVFVESGLNPDDILPLPYPNIGP